jgi:glycosyltransferase involved in cell wall biosynthesis
MNKEILVTVVAPVYNQAPYLRQMIESVLNQKTDFRYEFIIANDCSSDNSEGIIAEYACKYSQINFLNNPENLGAIRNYAQCLASAKGRYIAGLGGDDYWIDDHKLQMQVDFLEGNPDYGMVHTQFDELFMYKKFMQKQYQKNASRDGYELQGNIFTRLVANNTINAVTVCYRKSIIEESGLIDKFKNQVYQIEDLPMWLQISKSYNVGYIDKSTVCYRRNKNSVSHFKDLEKYKEYMNYVKDISKSFLTREELESEEIKEAFFQRDCITNTYLYFKLGDITKFKYYYNNLKQKSFDRKVMLWVLRFHLSFLFR